MKYILLFLLVVGCSNNKTTQLDQEIGCLKAMLYLSREGYKIPSSKGLSFCEEVYYYEKH